MKGNFKKANPNEYLRWLYDIVEDPEHLEHTQLLSTLDNCMFYALHPMDENRIKDGLVLREYFDTENNLRARFDDDTPCTMLEFLIGLAERMALIMAGAEEASSPSRWFWEMLHNVGLEEMDDDKFVALGGTELVKKICKEVCDRRYAKNGKSNLFPVSKSTPSQKDVEIWYQMQTYLNENYPI